MNKDSENSNQISIELPEDVADGIYFNLAMISHSESEFFLDFIRLAPAVPKAKVKSRVFTSPENAKRLLMALRDNIEKYEATFGKIQTKSEPPVYPMNFSGTVGEA